MSKEKGLFAKANPGILHANRNFLDCYRIISNRLANVRSSGNCLIGKTLSQLTSTSSFFIAHSLNRQTHVFIDSDMWRWGFSNEFRPHSISAKYLTLSFMECPVRHFRIGGRIRLWNFHRKFILEILGQLLSHGKQTEHCFYRRRGR